MKRCHVALGVIMALLGMHFWATAQPSLTRLQICGLRLSLLLLHKTAMLVQVHCDSTLEQISQSLGCRMRRG